MGSKKCFNAKNVFFLFSRVPIPNSRAICIRKPERGGGGHQGVKKNFFAFLDDSDHV